MKCKSARLIPNRIAPACPNHPTLKMRISNKKNFLAMLTRYSSPLNCAPYIVLARGLASQKALKYICALRSCKVIYNISVVYRKLSASFAKAIGKLEHLQHNSIYVKYTIFQIPDHVTDSDVIAVTVDLPVAMRPRCHPRRVSLSKGVVILISRVIHSRRNQVIQRSRLRETTQKRCSCRDHWSW